MTIPSFKLTSPRLQYMKSIQDVIVFILTVRWNYFSLKHLTLESKFSNTLEMGGGNTGYMFKIFICFLFEVHTLSVHLVYRIYHGPFLTSKNAI